MTTLTQSNFINKTELINIKALKWAIKNFDTLDIKRKVSQSLDITSYDKYSDKDMLKKILNNCSKNGQLQTKYKQAGTTNKGRYFVSGSYGLAPLLRELRGLIARDNYYDVDIVNCEPTLLYQFCDKNIPDTNITCLKNYVENRDILLNDLKNKYNLDKEEAKQIVLMISKGGYSAYDKLENKPEWLVNLKDEYVKIGEALMKKYKDEKDYIKKKKPKPFCIWGSLICLLIHDVENDIIQQLDNFLISKNYSVDTLIFDGVLVRNNKALNQETLDEASKYISDKTTYKVKFLIKKFDESVKLPDNILSNDEQYEVMKTEFEKNICKIITPPQYLNLQDYNKVHSYDDFEDHEIKYFCRKQLVEAFEDYSDWKGSTIIGGKAQKCFIDNWIKDPKKACYDKIDFMPYPLECPSTTFNLFKGFDIEKVEDAVYDEKYVNLFREHIKYLVDNDKQSASYLEKWFASIIQQPSIKTQVMICLKSNEGCGKNILLDIMAGILGHKYYISTANPNEDLFGKFNTNLTNKLLVNFDESQQTETNKFFEQLKAHITNPKVQIQPKGKDIFTIRDYCNNFSTSNNDVAFKITKTDRRFALFECTQDKRDEAYYKELFNMKNNKNALYSIYKYLKELDIKKFNFQTNRPITSYYKRCVDYFECNIYEYLQQLVYTTIYDDGEEIMKYKEDSFRYQSSSLYKNYELFCKNNKYISLSIKTFSLFIGNILTKTAINGKRYFIVNQDFIKEHLIKHKYWREEEEDKECLITDSDNEEIKEEVKNEIKEEIKEEIKKEVKKDIKKDIKKKKVKKIKPCLIEDDEEIINKKKHNVTFDW